MVLKVAIVGRPNVGKSTLFNRLVGKRLALVDDTPGVTRDRRHGQARLGHLQFEAIDTAGLETAAGERLAGRMRAQTEQAISAADLCLFLIDARAGVTPADEEIAGLVRRIGKPCVLIANKVEGKAAMRACSMHSASASASRFRFRPNMEAACPICSTPSLPPPDRAVADEERGDEEEEKKRTKTSRPTGRSQSPSSAGRMSANRRWSTA